MTNPKYIKQLWENYLNVVVPKGASQVQIGETQQAFYAGACSLHTFLMQALDDDHDVTEDDVCTIECIAKELGEWGEGFDAKLKGTIQ